jgi:hypothetical protein
MCCGKKRAQARKTIKKKKVTKPEEKTASKSQPNGSSSPYFQYLGNKYQGRKALIVKGPLTRKHYRFDRPGVVVAVDPRDVRAMAAMSLLRQVDGEETPGPVNSNL